VQNQSVKDLLTWAEIDLFAIADNLKALKKNLHDPTQTMAVVKANAYGHGAIPVAKTALAAGADWLAVSRATEGVALRKAGITARILVMGYCLPAQAEIFVANNLTPAVTTLEAAHALALAAHDRQTSIAIHLKMDSGMGRLGLLPEDVSNFAKVISAYPQLKIEGIFSHFASADEADPSYSLRQLQIFKTVIQRLKEANISIPIKHLSNSAAAMALPSAQFDMVRLGIAMYGLSPSHERNWAVPLHPAMSLKTRIARVKTLPAGASVGYGRTYIAQKPTPIALAPVGYGDGYLRLCSNRGAMLVHGKRAPIAGRVSMDQTSLDVSGIENIKENDEVVVFGKQGDETLHIDEVAAWAETINYEIVTALAARVPRVYFGAEAFGVAD